MGTRGGETQDTENTDLTDMMYIHRLMVVVSNYKLMCGNTDDDHTDMGHTVHNGRSAFIMIALSFSQSNHTLIISHTDANHTDTDTATKHKHIFKKFWRKK